METITETAPLLWTEVKKIFKITISLETILTDFGDILEIRINSKRLENSWVGRFAHGSFISKDMLVEHTIRNYLKESDLYNILGEIKINEYE
jgi:hypothetical protein